MSRKASPVIVTPIKTKEGRGSAHYELIWEIPVERVRGVRSVLNEFTNVVREPRKYLKSLKNGTGKKIIGCFPMHVPEEIIHSADLLPVTLARAESDSLLSDRYLQPSICHIMRSNFDLLLKGELDYLDGIVFCDICDAARILPDICRRHREHLFQYTILVSGKRNSTGRNFIAEEFSVFKETLEKFTGNRISTEKLASSIRTYNQNRVLLNNLYLLRREHPDILSPEDVSSIVMAAMLMPKEEHNKLLSQLLELLKNQEKAAEEPLKRAKLLLSGSLCTETETKILTVISNLKAVIIEDDLYVGRRYFDKTVNTNLSPMEGLVEHYTWDVPCPTKDNQALEWASYLVKLAYESKADAVISIVPKYCEPYSFAYPFIKRRLVSGNIPDLVIEVDASTSTQQIRTRIEGLIEIIEGI